MISSKSIVRSILQNLTLENSQDLVRFCKILSNAVTSYIDINERSCKILKEFRQDYSCEMLLNLTFVLFKDLIRS